MLFFNMESSNSLDIDLDLYSFLSKLGSYIFLAFCFLYQFQSQPYIINQSFLYFNLSIVASVFILIFLVALDIFGERKYKSFFWLMFVADAFVLFSIAEFGSLSPLIFSFLLCINILASSLVATHALTNIVAGVSCLLFTIFFIRSGYSDSTASMGFFIINLMGMSLLSFIGQSLKDKIFNVKEKMDLVLESLKKQRTLNQVIFDSMKSCIFVLNPKGSLISTNTKGEELLGEYKFLISRLKSLFNSTNNTVTEAKVELGEKYFVIQKSPLKHRDHSVPLGDVYLATDETLKNELSKKLTEAEKLAAVGRLSAGLAHEIRNPLAGISGSVELLQDGLNAQSDEDKKLYGIVLKEIERLNSLVTEFLTFAQPEVEKKDSVSMKDFLSEIVHLLQQDFRFKSLDLEIDTKIENYLLVIDRDKLKQAVMNIIVNAAQSMEKKSGPKVVTVKGLVIDDGYEILVSDQGEGIKEEHLNKIFEPFHTTKVKGTGLGLAITRRIIESHDAELSVSSQVGKGTSFSIKIPKKDYKNKFIEEVK